MKLSGIFTALITPFDKKGEIDFESLEGILESQTLQGADGFVVAGTTGESPCLSEKEKEKIYRFVKDKAPNLPLIVGTGTNCTKTTIESSKKAEDWGASCLMIVTPYYNKPSGEGLKAHFEKIAENITADFILYNVPSRTGVSVSADLVAELSAVDGICGIKEATGNMDFLLAIQKERQRKGYRNDFSLISGDDFSFDAFLSHGGNGIISVCSHFLLPEMNLVYKDMTEKGFSTTFHPRWQKLQEFLSLLYKDSNPIGVKRVLYLAEKIKTPHLRLPLVTSSQQDEKLQKSLHEQKLHEQKLHE